MHLTYYVLKRDEMPDFLGARKNKFDCTRATAATSVAEFTLDQSDAGNCLEGGFNSKVRLKSSRGALVISDLTAK